MSATDTYRSARNLLLDLRDDPDKADATFEWPDLGERFNWAVDWFDAVARGNDRLALWIVEEDGSQTKVTYDEMAARSDQRSPL